MTKVIALIFFTLLGISIAAGRPGLIGDDPKTWSPATTVDDCDNCTVQEPEDFVEVVCPPKKKFSWLRPFW